jgi:SAM-dependent methyltransferase
MTQITHGVRAVLSHPAIYSIFQNLMGAREIWGTLAKDYIRPFSGMRILDIGCGPADILSYLPNVDYYGFDISDVYIAQAIKNFGKEGNFYCQELTYNDLNTFSAFDVVLGCGLLHHLDDVDASNVLQIAFQALKPGGRLITIDPCLDSSQNRIARFLVKKDRGQNIRSQEGYATLVKGIYSLQHIKVRHRKWLPYTHCLMECSKI